MEEKSLKKLYAIKSEVLNYHLFPYLTKQDAMNISKVNKRMKKIISDYVKIWGNFIKKLKREYNLIINEIDSNRIEAVCNKRKYLIKGKRASYMKIESESISHLIEFREIFSSFVETRYWKFIKIKNSLNEVTPCLKNSDYINLNLNFSSVGIGLYDIYLKHGISDCFYMQNPLLLKCVSYNDNENIILGDYQITQNNFIDGLNRMITPNKIIDVFLFQIDTRKINMSLLNLTIEFYSCGLISGWLIDGILIKKKYDT